MMSEPAPKGFRMPAEWKPQAAVWLSWPVSTHIWPGRKNDTWETFARLAARCSYHQPVAINAAGAAHAEITSLLNRAKCDLTVTTLYDHATDDVWCRDHGPIWLKNDATGEVALTDWRFNAWGGKFEPFDQDDATPKRIADSLGLRRFAQDEILEGGAVECDGDVTILTTEAVLCNNNRDGLDRTTWEKRLREALAIEEVVWLPDGLPNDDTDGHIDNIVRFTKTGAVLAVEPDGVPVLEENLAILRRRFKEVLTIPRPAYFHKEERTPASYANFLVLNDYVIVPAYGETKKDEAALGLVRESSGVMKGELFDCRLLIEEGGALHCLTSNQPL